MLGIKGCSILDCILAGLLVQIAVGDVLTIPRTSGVLVIRIEALPERRGPPAEARECYSLLDRAGTDPLAAARDTNGAQG